MSLHLDLKYINLTSNRFQGFTRKKDYLFNVRCPICGDSQKDKTKMRGYIYRSKNRMSYKCHNCNESMGFGKLLKLLDQELYKEWALEVFKELRPGSQKLHQLTTHTTTLNQEPVRFGNADRVIYNTAEMVKDLPDGHMCKDYVKRRRIPEKFWDKLYFSPSYRDFIAEIAPEQANDVSDDSRLVIPYYDKYGAVVAVTGRDLIGNPRSIRYITIRVDKDDETKLVYGLDRVDQSKHVTIVEGPMDSLFLNNAVASGDANLRLVAKRLTVHDVTLVYDNEPRNYEIVKQLTKSIQMGHKVCIWPDWVHEKDINDMILAGRTANEIEQMILDNTHSGLAALTHLSFWRK